MLRHMIRYGSLSTSLLNKYLKEDLLVNIILYYKIGRAKKQPWEKNNSEVEKNRTFSLDDSRTIYS